MRKLVIGLAVAAVLLALAYHFFALEIFNFAVPKDAGTEAIARDVPFGPDPAQTLDVYAPEGRQSGLPVLVFVHGGSWESGSKNGYDFAGRTFAAQGYLTLVAGYRKRPAHAYPAFIEDAALALAFAQGQSSRYGGDGSRVYAVGHSAGAYNLAMAVLDQRYLLAAGVDPGRLRAVATLAGPFDFLPLDTRVSQDTFGQVADLPSTQPVNFARGDAPPFLLLTGDGDTTVRPRNSKQMYANLKAAGTAVEIKTYPGVGHVGILLRTAQPFRSEAAPVLADILRFFSAH